MLAPARAFALAALAGCASPGAGPAVTAPLLPASAPPAARSSPGPHSSGGPAACGQSWLLEDVSQSDARVLVVCGSDVLREAPRPGPMTRALNPALDSARERVCACAGRVAVPSFVDLVVTALPDEGHASVVASDPDDSLDQDVARAFVACVGTLSTTFPRFHADACDGAIKYVYTLDIELDR